MSGDAGCARTEKHGSASNAAKATNQLLLRRVSLPVCVAIGDAPGTIWSTRYCCPVALEIRPWQIFPDIVGTISQSSRNDRNFDNDSVYRDILARPLTV